MEGANGIFIVDQEHRIRNAQISNCDAKRSVHETFRQVMAFKFSDKKKVAIPSTWDDIRSPNITKNDVKKLDFYSALP
jgi:alkyl hydroperoxide reductase subunit AhpC